MHAILYIKKMGGGMTYLKHYIFNDIILKNVKIKYIVILY